MDYRDYMKDRMKQARNSTSSKAKVSTVNKFYKPARGHSKSPQKLRKDSSVTNINHLQSEELKLRTNVPSKTFTAKSLALGSKDNARS